MIFWVVAVAIHVGLANMPEVALQPALDDSLGSELARQFAAVFE
jgi:hypothetical protein